MKRFSGVLNKVPTAYRFVAAGLVAVMAVFLLWFFIFRDTSTTGRPAGVPAPRPALGKTVAYAQYRAAISSALEDVRAAMTLQGGERTKRLESAAKSLEGVEGAGVPEGASNTFAQVDNTILIAELRALKPDIDALEGSLSTLSTALQEMEQGKGVAGAADGEQAKAELRGVLGDSAFNYEKNPSPLARLARWLASILGNPQPGEAPWRLFGTLMAAVAAGLATFLGSERLGNRWARYGLALAAGLLGGALFYAASKQLDVTIQVLGAAGLLVVVVAAALIFGGLYTASAPPTRPRTLSELAVTLGMNAAEARRRADEAANSGDYRLGIRYRCLAVLLALDEAGKLLFDRTATDREYLFKAPGHLQEELQPLLDRFERVWYGEVPTGAEDWAAYSSRAAAIEAKVRSDARSEVRGGTLQESEAR